MSDDAVILILFCSAKQSWSHSYPGSKGQNPHSSQNQATYQEIRITELAQNQETFGVSGQGVGAANWMPKFGKAGEKRPKLFDITRKEIAEEENQVHCESDCALEEQAIQQESGET